MSQGRRRALQRRKLALGDSSAVEEGADRAAAQAFAAKPGVLARGLAGLGGSPTASEPVPPGALARGLAGLGGSPTASEPVPPSVRETVAAPGRALNGTLRGDLERRFGAGFGSVRLHTDADAQRSAREVNAQAYSVGNDVVFGAGRFAPGTAAGRHLLAHELAHVVQHRGTGIVHRYRDKSSWAFGELDTPALVEQSFKATTDKETKPWIELVTVEFAERLIDTDGNEFWTGTATVHYHDNPVKLPDFNFPVAGGSEELGKTTAGLFTVQRIEGVGYNSGSASGTPGTDFQWSEREGPLKRYSKRDPVTGRRSANMHFAVFFHKGEALHVGPLGGSSHGCVHVDGAFMKQVNYHSVIGLTQVNVSYVESQRPHPSITDVKSAPAPP